MTTASILLTPHGILAHTWEFLGALLLYNCIASIARMVVYRVKNIKSDISCNYHSMLPGHPSPSSITIHIRYTCKTFGVYHLLNMVLPHPLKGCWQLIRCDIFFASILLNFLKVILTTHFNTDNICESGQMHKETLLLRKKQRREAEFQTFIFHFNIFITHFITITIICLYISTYLRGLSSPMFKNI